MDPRYKEKAQIVKQYAQAVAAKLALEADFNMQTVEVSDLESAIKIENNKAPPKIADLIKQLFNQTSSVPLSGENGDYHKRVVVKAASGANIVTIRQTDKPGEYDVWIESQAKQDSPTGKIKIEDARQPTFHVSMNLKTKELSVKVGEQVVVKESDLTPREMQRKAIEQYADAVIRGEPAQVAVMGTGSGKSWVQSGFTTAIGAGVYIVPDQDLAKETEKDAIDGIHNIKDPAKRDYKVVHADTLSVTQVQEQIDLINKGERIHLILRANDPQFAEKAAVIKGQFVMMDESHQHTFTDKGMETLKALKTNNALLALTGTPTKRLMDEFGPAMTEINIRSIMDKGEMRRIQPAMTAEKSNENLVEELVKRYLGNDTYLNVKDKGHMSIEAAKKANPGMSDQDALKLAVEHNRIRQAEQKNFAFSTNKWYRIEIADAYNNMHKNPQLKDKLLPEIMAMRRESEINARVQLLMEQNPKQDEKQVRIEVEKSVGPKVINLEKEMQAAQKKQIALTVNAEVVALCLGSKMPDMEKFLRLVELNKYLASMTDPKDATKAKILADFQNMSETDIRKGFASKYPSLPAEQRKEYIELLVQTALKFQAAFKTDPANSQEWTKGLAKPEDINLQKLQTKNAEIVQLSDPKAADDRKKQESAQRAAALDGLRTGLTMQLVSDKVYATGISVQSVLSTQQLVSQKEDLDPIYIAQLHGRDIRASDLAAVNDQVVSKNIKKEDVLSVADLIDPKSGDRMGAMYARQDQAEAKRKSTVEDVRASFEARAKEVEQPAPSPSPGKR